ncbi:hypothetical protein ACA910_012341 [Epithemia clementina (nom. ined.)]
MYRLFRFCFALENSKVKGYMTDKIVLAFLSGCVPVYYGPDEIFDIFNREAFIYYNIITDPEPALQRIAYLEANETAYDMVLLAQPILTNDGNKSIEKYFSLRDDDIGNGVLKNKIRDRICLSVGRLTDAIIAAAAQR